MVATLAGCLDTTQTEVRPDIWLPLQDVRPTEASLPGTVLDVLVSWTALCTTEGLLPDTSTTENCDEQDFIATVTCSGGPCELDPPTAATGLPLTGEGKIQIAFPAAGDIAVNVEIARVGSKARLAKRGQIAIRPMERLVVDCRLQAYDPAMPRCVQRTGFIECFDGPWIACPATAAIDPVWGTPVSIWVYGEGGGLPISAVPATVEVTGLGISPSDYVDTAHPLITAGWIAQKFREDMKVPGTLRLVAQQNGMVGETTLQLVRP